MIDFSKPVQTKEGKEVRIYTTEGMGKYPVVGQVKYIDGDWLAVRWTLSGENQAMGGGYSLINVPEKHVRYLNCYHGLAACAYTDKKTADEWADQGRIACIRIEFEDGQFDD